jgi:hypothetical protein
MASLQLLEREPGLWRLRVRHQGRDSYQHVRGDRPAAQAAGDLFLADVEQNGHPPLKRPARWRRGEKGAAE